MDQTSRIFFKLLIAFEIFQSILANTLFLIETQGVTKEYEFAIQGAENGLRRKKCLGLSIGIECLEEGKEVAGVDSSVELANRIWSRFTKPQEQSEFTFRRELTLQNGIKVPICSKSAIEEIGQLIQEKYEHLVSNELWQDSIENPDPNTPEGRRLLEVRQKYLDIFEANRRNRISSAEQLKEAVVDDKDGLVAISALGVRVFDNASADEEIDEFESSRFDGSIDHPRGRPSSHAFLLCYVREKDCFFVYDSNAPRKKHPVTLNASGEKFSIAWQLENHLGRGPSYQIYHDVWRLDMVLKELKSIVPDEIEHASRSFPEPKKP